MNERLPDQRLRDAFARLHRELAPLAPNAERFVERARIARPHAGARSLAPGLALASVLAVLAIVAVWNSRQASERAVIARQAAQLGESQWRAPTDFLLDVPGADLLRTTPAFDAGAPATPSTSENPTS